MSNGTRRHFTPQQEAEIVRRHLSSKEAISALADELQIQPGQIHGWVKRVLDQAETAFRKPANRRVEEAKDRRIGLLEDKLIQKNEVIAELMKENVRAKKANRAGRSSVPAPSLLAPGLARAR
jgi:transposase